MKQLLFAIIIWTLCSFGASAQCNGVFPNNTACGNITGGGTPKPIPLSSFPVAGGTNGQVQYNNAGALGGLTNTQLTALLNAFTATLSGVVPASGGGTVNYLRADGTFAQPGNVIGTGSSVVGNVPKLSNTSTTGITDSGIPSTALPTLPGNLPAIVPTSSTVTISNASPGVVTWTAHGLPVGTPVAFQTTGTLPSPLIPGVIITGSGSTSGATNIPGGGFYFVIPLTANTFELATTYANALASVPINTTTAGSGTHTAVANSTLVPGSSGYLYEVELASGSAINLPFQTSTLLLSLTLPAGVYDLFAQVDAITAGGALASEYHSSISTLAGGTIVAFPNEGGNDGAHILYRANQTNVLQPGPKRIFLTTSTTINLQAYSTFGTDANGSNGSGSQTMYGYLRAERR